MKFMTPKATDYPLHIIYNDQTLKFSVNVKFLGVCPDNHLGWEKYSDDVINKLSVATFVLRKLQPIVSRQVLKMAYCAYCQAQLKYCVIFWGSSSSSMKRVFVAQKRAIRAMLMMRPRSSCREVFR